MPAHQHSLGVWNCAVSTFRNDGYPRLATATDGAAENRPANRLGGAAWPRSEKARTARPPIRALREIRATDTCYNSDIRLQVNPVNTKEGRTRCQGVLVRSGSGSTKKSNRARRNPGGTVLEIMNAP